MLARPSALPQGLFVTADSDSEELTFSYLHLIDNMTGEDVDLLPTHGLSDNQDADETPIGSGMAVLALLGGAYLVGKKRREE